MLDDPNASPKAIAAVLGAVTAIAFQPPHTLKGVASKLTVSLLTGYMTGVPLAKKLGFPTEATDDIRLAVFAVSVFAWVLISAGTRTLKGWKPKD